MERNTFRSVLFCGHVYLGTKNAHRQKYEVWSLLSISGNTLAGQNGRRRSADCLESRSEIQRLPPNKPVEVWLIRCFMAVDALGAFKAAVAAIVAAANSIYFFKFPLPSQEVISHAFKSITPQHFAKRWFLRAFFYEAIASFRRLLPLLAVKRRSKTHVNEQKCLFV